MSIKKMSLLVAGICMAGLIFTLPVRGETDAAAADSARPLLMQRLLQTPLGRRITERIGQWMVLRSQLNLTEQQRQSFRTILTEHRSEIAQTLQPVAAARRALRDAVLADHPDQQQIRAAADALGKAIGDAALVASKLRALAADILTDEQRQLIRQHRDQCDQNIDTFLKEMTENK